MPGFFNSIIENKGATIEDLHSTVALPMEEQRRLLDKAASFKSGDGIIKSAVDCVDKIQQVVAGITSPKTTAVVKTSSDNSKNSETAENTSSHRMA